MLVLCMTALRAAGETTGAAGATAHAAGLAMWQAQDSINSGHAIWLEVFVTVAAISLAVQAAVVVGVALVALKAQKAIVAEIAVIKGKVMPLIDKSHGLVTDLTPEIKAITTKVHDITQKVDVITAHIEEIAGLAKDKAHEFAPTISAANVTFGEANDTAREANQKVRAQVTRVNGMVSSTLDATARFGKAIERGISLPGREIAGFVSGAKSTIDSLLKTVKTAGAKPASRGPAPAYRAAATPPRATGFTPSPTSHPQSAGGGVPVSSGVPVRTTPEVAIIGATAAFEAAEKRGDDLDTL